MSRVLITGGAGFIGSNVANHLVNEGYEVMVVDNLLAQIHSSSPRQSYLYNSLDSRIEFVLGDVRDRELMKELVSRANAVIHLAAETAPGQSMYEVDEYVDANVGGTGTLISVLQNTEHSVNKLILGSSRAIYGEGRYVCEDCGRRILMAKRDPVRISSGSFDLFCDECGSVAKSEPTTESEPANPPSVYAATKLAQEHLVTIGCEGMNINYLIFRMQNVYGVGQALNNPYTGILAIFANRLLNGKYVEIFEDGLESRDFVFVDDVVDAYCRALEVDESTVLNLGSGKALSVLEVANKIAHTLGVVPDIRVSGRYRTGDIRSISADTSAILSKLGWEPKVSFDKGLEIFLNWVKEQNPKNDSYERSLKELKEKGLY